MTLRRHTAHCTFGGGLPCGSTPRHPALPIAPARCGRLARLWGSLLPPSPPCHLGPSALRPARAQCGAIREAALPLCPPLYPGPLALSCPLSARPLSPCPAPRPWLQGLRPPYSLSLSLCSLASSSLPPPPGQREHGAEQFARQPSLSAPPLCSRSLAQPCPLCVRSPSSSLAPLPKPLGPWPSVSLSPSFLYPPQHTLRGAIREAPLPLPLHLAVPWCRGPWACGTHVALHPPAAFVPLRPPRLLLPPLPFALSTPRRTLRKTLCRQVARMSQARTWPSLHDTTQDTPPLGVDCLVAARRGAPPCPVPPRTAGGSLGCGAPFCSCPTFALSCRRGTPSSLPCHLCSSALRPARARCGAIGEAALPLCPLSLPRPRGPVLPPVCSPSLVLPCPPSQVPWSLALCLSVPVLPLPPRHTLRGAIREAPLPLPLHLAAPWCPGPWACGTHVALHQPAACVPLLPPCLPLPPLPFSLSTLRRTLRRTLCRQVARMSQARTWPLSSAPSGWLAPRCGCPPLPQPPLVPPPRAATPNAAGGAALVGPGCPPARVSLYPPRRLVAGGDPSQKCARHRKKIDIYIYIYIYGITCNAPPPPTSVTWGGLEGK